MNTVEMIILIVGISTLVAILFGVFTLVEILRMIRTSDHSPFEGTGSWKDIDKLEEEDDLDPEDPED